MMYKGHVYADPAFVTSDHLARRMQTARQPSARFASASFVTGALDPFPNREGFLAAARRLEIPVLRDLRRAHAAALARGDGRARRAA